MTKYRVIFLDGDEVFVEAESFAAAELIAARRKPNATIMDIKTVKR